jgi:pyruvate,water dikinase
MGTQFTVSLHEPQARDPALVGGKGASLARMMEAGLPVPGGFCVTTHAYRTLTADSAVHDHVQALAQLDLEDPGAVARSGSILRRLIRACPIPDNVLQAMVAALEEHGTDAAYAVRSSATAEDLPEASFAGQQDTFLNVRGAEGVLERLLDCMASLFTDRAIVYRSRNMIPHEHLALAVVVQHMVEPEASGILFTVDPVTGHRHTASIDAGFGLGEALVSGVATADVVRVDKLSGDVQDYHVGDKRVAVRALADGGTETIELSSEVCAERVLTEDQARSLVELGVRLERLFGSPQDVEWALVDGQPVVLQSRPITSLFPLPTPMPDDNALHVYWSWGHKEAMPEAMPPLVVDTWRRMMPLGRERGSTVPSTLIVSAGGRIYIDYTKFLTHPLLRRRVLTNTDDADELAGAALREVVARPGFLDGPRASMSELMRMLPPGKSRILSALFFADPTGVPDREKSWTDAYAASAAERVRAVEALPMRLRAVLGALDDGAFELMGRAYPLFAGMLAERWLRRLFADAREDVDAITRGFPDDIITKMNLELGDVADAARAHPAAVEAIRAGRSLDEVREVAGGDAFGSAFDAFLSEYGFRGYAEIDISRPRWSEDPAMLLQTVRGRLAADKAGAHHAHMMRLVEARQQAAQRLEQRAGRGLLGSIRRRWVRRLICVARAYLAIREHPKYGIAKLLARAREHFLAAGRMLVADGRLEMVGDVWYLQLDELLTLVSDRAATSPYDLVARRAEFRRHARMDGPRVFTSDGEIVYVSLEREGVPEGALVGTPASAGVIEGRARVVLDPSGVALEPGEILVAPFCDPGWTPLFLNAAALVTEVGGLMTHGVLVAREYGIPAVVSVPEATTRIRTGQRICVDGTRGFVVIASSSPS